FPEAKFIHVIRDGRDVALSYLWVAWGPRTLWEAARKWRRDVSAGRRHGASLGPERYLEVRYERLVAEPRRVLELVCDFAGLSFDERMLAFHTHARLQGRPEWRGFHASVTKPVTGGLRDWSTQMPEQQVLAFEAVAGGLLEELGYPRRHEGIPLPWRAGARVRMGVLALKVLGSRAEEALLQAAKRLRG
ncbi:MAG: sulfotransferase, partial [Actinomycetota bacterium]|nr:sulfotransferase [Actinomycetota bacterium]